MKPLLFLFLVVMAVACNPEEESTLDSMDNGALLIEIQVNDKVYDAYEYQGTQLMKEQSFGFFCETHPSNEFDYTYENGRLSGLRIINRGIYSNLHSQCNPTLGISTEERFEYDAQGRMNRVVRAASYTVFRYNANNQIEKQILFLPDHTEKSTAIYRYDMRGNIIEEEDINGNITFYEYDNQKNPYYYINQRPGWVSPFNHSPNNVIRATGQQQFERTPLAYNDQGFPTQIKESTNGLVYTYVYR